MMETLSLQRHLQNMLSYHKGLRVRKKPPPFVAGAFGVSYNADCGLGRGTTTCWRLWAAICR